VAPATQWVELARNRLRVIALDIVHSINSFPKDTPLASQY